MPGDGRIREAIEAIVARLVAHYAPQKIILFGSYAHGQPDEDSDIDLLIIKDTPERFVDRMTTVRRLTRGTHDSIPFDPLVYTPAEIEHGQRTGDQFLAEILERGEVLYGV
ncbi:MAG: nucleotidyltransferase domain-containing protein [Acidobacteria bacterium]|jgi:predicted nucleotidyltransferase|nr:nucleotidyltransferase domain-containing protein [Acidobacteriota bacterium]